jgi:allantoin racemase
MSNLMDRLSAEHSVPVLDGVACATTLAEALVGAGLRTSKVGAYASPRPKNIA